jgi:low temperature requirement protein LtrA
VVGPVRSTVVRQIDPNPDSGQARPQIGISGKRVSWVELYFDLVFVFAVAQCSRVIVTEPTWSGAWTALGQFIPMWWTWIGFVVFVNRRTADSTANRLVVLAGTVPCAVAAIELHGSVGGSLTGFAWALAGARAVLAVGFLQEFGGNRGAERRTAIGYLVSMVLLIVAGLLPSPIRYVAWGVALAEEGVLLLLGPRRQNPRTGRRTWGGLVVLLRQIRLARPSLIRDPDLAVPSDQPTADRGAGLDAAHLAERFGLFMIILLGEIVVSVGSAAITPSSTTPRYWLGVAAGLVLIAALWWIYFTVAAHIDEFSLRTSGGSPGMAYGLYAGGHLPPAFALLTMAAGVTLAMRDRPPSASGWLITGGLALFLAGIRAVVVPAGRWMGGLIRPVVLALTVGIALLGHWLTGAGVLAVAAGWALALAIAVSLQGWESTRASVPDPATT